MGFRIETIMEKGKINWKGIVNLLHNHDKRIQDIEEHGGGGGGYDDTAIKRRITAVENGKQNLLTAGNGITILEDTISAVNILNDTKESTTTVWSSSKVKALFESLTGKVNVSIVATKPPKSSAVNNTMYYVGTESPYDIWFFVNDDYTDFGSTALDLSDYFTKDEVNDLLEEKVDKVTGKSLVLDTDIAQITTNKTDIANIKDDENLTSFGKVKLEFENKVDKETGKSLVLDTDIAQITTNKNDIVDLTTSNFRNGVIITTIGTSSGNSTIPTGGAVRVALNQKQNTIIASDQLTAPSDTDKLSYVNNVTNNRWTFAKIWDWVVGKLTSNTEKGIQVSDGKLGHTNSITAPSTSARFICGVLDEQGHFKGTPTAFQYGDVYNSSLDNCLFTRKGANNLYNWAKITDESGNNAVTTTGMDSALTRTSGSHQSTVSRIMKHCGVVSLQYFGQYSASSAISGKFTCIGSVPSDYKPASQTAIQVTTWNATPAGSASGYITTAGKIYVWVSSIGSGATNIQYVINATWKGA